MLKAARSWDFRLFIWFGFDLGFLLGFFPPFILTLTLIFSHLVLLAFFLATSLLLLKEDSHETITSQKCFSSLDSEDSLGTGCCFSI